VTIPARRVIRGRVLTRFVTTAAGRW